MTQGQSTVIEEPTEAELIARAFGGRLPGRIFRIHIKTQLCGRDPRSGIRFEKGVAYVADKDDVHYAMIHKWQIEEVPAKYILENVGPRPIPVNPIRTGIVPHEVDSPVNEDDIIETLNEGK